MVKYLSSVSQLNKKCSNVSGSLRHNKHVGSIAFWLNAARLLCSKYVPVIIFSFTANLVTSLFEGVSISATGCIKPGLNFDVSICRNVEYSSASSTIFIIQWLFTLFVTVRFHIIFDGVLYSTVETSCRSYLIRSLSFFCSSYNCWK